MKTTFTTLVLVAVLATAAHAQPGGRLALGPGVGLNDYGEGAFHGKTMKNVP
jgi:hypothetical protein